MYIVKVFVQMELLPDTRSPYLQVLIYTMGKTISIYLLQLVLNLIFTYSLEDIKYALMAEDKIMPQHNDTANCTLQVENITLIFRNVTSYDLNM